MTEHGNALKADPRQVKAMDWPVEGSADDKLLFLLSYAVLAPSILNAEPWRFRRGGSLTLSEGRIRRLGAVDPDGREAAPTIATISLSDAITQAAAEDRRLRDAIPERRTVRGRFEVRPVPHEVLNRLQEAAATEGALLAWSDEAERRREVALVVAEAERAHLECAALSRRAAGLAA